MSEVTAAAFVLAVTDLEKSRAFYCDKPGFVEDLQVEGWSFLRRGACRLRIGDCLKNRGVEIWHPLQDKPWNMREFAIVTPDGHRIVFGEILG